MFFCILCNYGIIQMFIIPLREASGDPNLPTQGDGITIKFIVIYSLLATTNPYYSPHVHHY
jgi:hypothetical protein